MVSFRSSLSAAVRRVRSLALLSFTLLALGQNPTVHAEPFAYIGNGPRNTVTVVDTANNAFVTTIPVGANPVGVAVTPNGRFVYVTHIGANSVSVLDAVTNTKIASIAVGSRPVGVAVSPDGSTVYVANSDSRTISVIDSATNTVIASITGVGNAYAIAVTPDGDHLYVTNPNGFSVTVVDTMTNTVSATIPPNPDEEEVHVTTITISPDGTRAYAALDFDQGVWVIDTSTNTIVTTVSVGNLPDGIAVTRDSAFVYVANGGDRTVSVIATDTNNVVATIPLPLADTPTGIAVTPDGASVYVITDSRTGSVIDIATNTVTATFPVGLNPLSLGQFIGPVVCGNGQIGGGEQCDDGNFTNGDGCSSTCAVEPGYRCSGEPSVCQSANRPPVAQCQNVTVTTDPNTCATVAASIDNGSSDPDGNPLSFSQTPAGPYAQGTTAVTLTVSDGTLSSACSGMVTVLDGQAPTLACPANQTVSANGPNGTVVNFSPTASDNCGTVITSCTPGAESMFPIGTTPVTCTTTDGAGRQASCGFSVTVTANVLTQIDALIATVQNLPVLPTVKLTLTTPLRVAKTALQRNQTQIACTSMQAFEGLVARFRRANVLTPAQAADLITASQRIRTAIGCP